METGKWVLFVGMSFGGCLGMNVKITFDRVVTLMVACFALFAGFLQGAEVQPQQVASTSHYAEVLKAHSELVLKLNERTDIKELKVQLNLAQARYVKALEGAIEKEDPKLLENYKALRASRGQTASTKVPQGFSALSKEEKDKLKAARDKAIKQESVQEARKKKDAAMTIEERKLADSAYDKALRAAILKEDATLVDVLAKFDGKSDKKEP